MKFEHIVSGQIRIGRVIQSPILFEKSQDVTISYAGKLLVITHKSVVFFHIKLVFLT